MVHVDAGTDVPALARANGSDGGDCTQDGAVGEARHSGFCSDHGTVADLAGDGLGPSGTIYFDTRASHLEFALGSAIAALAPYLRLPKRAAQTVSVVALGVLVLFLSSLDRHLSRTDGGRSPFWRPVPWMLLLGKAGQQQGPFRGVLW